MAMVVVAVVVARCKHTSKHQKERSENTKEDGISSSFARAWVSQGIHHVTIAGEVEQGVIKQRNRNRQP